jgi:F-type H+-transporting ATPase subunit a
MMMRKAFLPPLALGLLLAGALLFASSPAVASDPPQHEESAQAGESHAEPASTQVDEHGATEGHGAEAEHGGEHGEAHGQHLELPNITMILKEWVLTPGTPLYHYVEVFENAFFALLAGLFLTIVSLRVYNNRQVLPGRLQSLMEMIIEWIEGLAVTMMGPRYGRHYAPFVATIFVYLLAMNYSALIPLGKAPTATWFNNLSIAIVVFLYVQYTGIRENGIGGYLHHLAGSPKDAVGWALSPLLFALELFGEFVKPVSLSLRLFGNIFGEDMLLAVFALLGVVAVSSLGSPIGIPLHLPFLFLSLLLGLIQALVFSLLSTVYIALMLPHDDHGHGEHAEAH